MSDHADPRRASHGGCGFEVAQAGLSRTAVVAASVGEQNLTEGLLGRRRSQVNMHPSVVYRTLVGPDALLCLADTAAGAEVEPPEVSGASYHAVPDQAAGQRGFAVRAPVVDCARLPVGERHAYHVPVMFDSAGGPLAEFLHAADPYPAHGQEATRMTTAFASGKNSSGCRPLRPVPESFIPVASWLRLLPG